MKLTMLGTGSPLPNPQRRGPSQVVQCGDDHILIDCGAGTLHRLVEAGCWTQPLKAIAFTHLHSDHVTGVLDVLWAGWIQRRWSVPPTIYGPPGTRHFIDHLIQAMDYDIRVRSERAELLTRESLVPRVVEFEEGWGVEGSDWRMSAFRVEHLPVDQAFGFRIDQDSSSLAISGDTKVSENLIKHAQEVDILVHEVYWTRGLREAAAAVAHNPAERIRFELLPSYHTGSEDVGKVAAKANARHLVLSHFIRPRADADFAADIKPDYSGKLTVAEDLMTFEIGS
jgi:ribonuclease Z